MKCGARAAAGSALRLRRRGGPRRTLTGPRLEPGQASIVVVTRAPDRHAEALGDVAQRQLLEAGELEGGPLSLGQLREPRAQDEPSLFRGELTSAAFRHPVHLVERFSAIRGAPSQRGFAAERAVICVLEQPAPDRAARRVVEVRLAVDLEEDFLGDVLRFAGVV